jgi:hypothetical protein
MVATRTQTAQVTCINKPNRESSHEAITHLGGSGWRWTRAQVVQAIENQTNAFFTSAGGTVAWLVVRRGTSGKYVQTESDGKLTNNLLSLPEC